MAVCKNCGCAIPIGSKSCDICSVGSVAPAKQPVWTPPKETIAPARQDWIPPKAAAAPVELASSAASWAAPAVVRPAPPPEIQKAEQHVRSAWRWLAIVGVFYVILGLVTQLNVVHDPNSLFGFWAVLVGASFLVLSYFVRQGSIPALAIAIGIYALYTIAFFLAGYFAIFRIIILAVLLRWLGSAYLVNQHRKTVAPPSPMDQRRAA